MRTYGPQEVDLIAAHVPDLGRTFLLRADQFDGRTQVDLRLRASRNNQKSRVNWADDLDFSARLKALVGP